jgi:acid phosphatase type 7
MDTVHKGNSVAVPRLRFFGIPERVTRKGDTELSHLPDKFSLYRVRFRWKHPNIRHLLRHCESNQTFDMKIEVSVIILLCLATANAQTHPSISSGSKAEDPVLVGAGDIASCDDLAGAYATAKLIDKISGTVFAAGDLAYPNGSDEDFAKCYGPTWGRFKDRTRPSPGNHEYRSDAASGYAHYFGSQAGDPTKGYYSYDLGAWHIVSLNSECEQVGGCGASSSQGRWLTEDLAQHPAGCTLAYFHKPLFSSSGAHGNDPTMKVLWDILYHGGADIIVNGHDHDYERFAPQDPQGTLDQAHGIREFVAGSGGKNSHRAMGAAKPNSEARNDDTFGVLKFTLHASSYDWEFLPEEGKTFKDSGSGSCH